MWALLAHQGCLQALSKSLSMSWRGWQGHQGCVSSEHMHAEQMHTCESRSGHGMS